MKSLSCSCLAQRTSMEAPIPSRQIGFDTNTSTTARPRGLVRKNSKLQTHVEVLKCKLGKPTANSIEVNQIFGPSKHWTPIYYAVHHQREAALIHFLRTGGSPDVIDGVGVPPLCIAAANGSIEIVRILLEAGADINAQVKESGETALHIAIKQGRADIIELLLQYDPNLESHTTGTCETPLHYAASKSGSLATVVGLLKQGSKYDTPNAKGQSPAEAALSANNIQAAVAIINSARGSRNKLAKEKELLLKHVEKNQNKFSIGNELIADIFAAACDPDSTVLVEAIKRNDASLVELFLEKGADPDRETAKGLRPIFVALECAKASVIQVLVKHNVDVAIRDANGLTVLQAAFEGSSAQDKEAMSAIFDCLLEKGADAKVTYPDGKTLLHRAISSTFGHTRVALLLLRHGVKVNTKDNDGNTALHLATHNKSCIDVLLKNGAKAEQSNADDLTPLLYAMGTTERTSEPDFDTLIKASDLRRTNSVGQTALHLAASNGLEKTIHHLLRARAETMIVDTKKNTPLLLAVLGHQWHIVPLLTMPPSTNSWDEAGLTALHHIASSTPKGSSTWKDIAVAAVPFCQRGTSRSMRDRSGATPLILATKTLPEEGIPVIETLLMQAADRRMNWNCVGHEDHDGRDALFYAITLGKSSFVEALLKAGATFAFKDWLPNKRAVSIPAQADKQITKALAQYEWSRRAGALRRQSAGLDSQVTESPFATMFPVRDLKNLISMGLAPNALPKTSLGSSLIWAILRQVPLKPHLSPKYLYDSIKLILEYRADPNIGTARGGRRTPSPQVSTQDLPLSLHTLTFLLEEYPSVEADLVTMLLLKGTKLSIASPFYNGRFPLHSATKANRIDLVDEFLLQRAEVDCQDREGRTPLYIAAEKGFWEIAEALLRRSASVTIKDNEKNTVLHAAAAGGSKRIVSTLLRAGAKVGIKNGKDLKPLECIPPELEAKEKEKLTTLLQDWEEAEQRNTDRERKAVEQTAIQEAKTRLRKEEEAKAKLRREAEAKATMLKAQEESEQKLREQRAREQEKSRRAEASVIPPAEEKMKSSFFRSSLLSSRKSVSPAPVDAPSAPKILLDVQIHTTEPTDRNTPKETISSPGPKAIAPSSTPLAGTSSANSVPSPPNTTPTAAITEKRHASPRIDSGFGQKRAVDMGKPLPILDCSKTTLEGDDDKKRSSSATELADWLALSKMMDRL